MEPEPSLPEEASEKPLRKQFPPLTLEEWFALRWKQEDAIFYPWLVEKLEEGRTPEQIQKTLKFNRMIRSLEREKLLSSKRKT